MSTSKAQARMRPQGESAGACTGAGAGLGVNKKLSNYSGVGSTTVETLAGAEAARIGRHVLSLADAITTVPKLSGSMRKLSNCADCESTQWSARNDEAKCVKCMIKHLRNVKFDTTILKMQVVPYSEVYMVHPREFNFAANGDKVPSAYKPIVEKTAWQTSSRDAPAVSDARRSARFDRLLEGNSGAERSADLRRQRLIDPPPAAP